jgi:hypothetical protein
MKPFDPYPFNLPTMIVSLEAIFLSIWILISQNQMTRQADRRAHLIFRSICSPSKNQPPRCGPSTGSRSIWASIPRCT